MNSSFASASIGIVIALALGCVNNLAVADRSDGGVGDAPVIPDVPVVPDVPVIPDVPARDVPPGTDAPTLPTCSDEFDMGTAQDPDLRYYRAAFALPPAGDGGAGGSDAGADLDIVGTWAGLRALDMPIILGCPPGDARYACRRDTVIRVRVGATVHELVVTLAPDDLRGFTEGMPVRLTARAARWDGLYQRGTGPAELLLRRPADQALLLAIVTVPTAGYEGFDVPVAHGTPVCRNRLEPICRRTLQAYSLVFGSGAARVDTQPGDSGFYVTAGARYLVRNRAAVQRVPSGGMECADLVPPVTSFEIVRYPTP